MSISVPALQVTLDVGVTDGDVPMDDTIESSPTKEAKSSYCSCKSDYCDCGSELGVTEASAAKVYKHLGFKNGREDLLSQDYRPCALHIWGTHNLSTEDVLNWLSEYNPLTIEWINDASCNVVFSDENTVLRIIVDFAEPFDRRVALAAAAALASLISSKEEENFQLTNSDDPTSLSMKSDLEDRSLTVSSEALDSIEEFSQYLPPTGRWYKALAVPSQTISLFLRFAHKTDVKMPGAERRSLYYRRYGNPNYGGMTGILTRSYRRRLRTARKKMSGDQTGDLRYINVLPKDFAELIADAYEDFDDKEAKKSSRPDVFNFHIWDSKPTRPAPDRPLVVYDNLYDEDTTSRPMTKPHTGQRRNANDFSAPKSPKQPRKWPRRDRGPPPNRWITNDYEFEPPRPGSVIVLDPREPWGDKSTSGNTPFIFSGSRSGGSGSNHSNTNRNTGKYRSTNSRNHITTITMMPDSDSDTNDKPVYEEDENALRTRRLLASMTMVADLEEETSKHRSLADRLGTRNNKTTTFGSSSSRPMTNRKGTVWQRLG